MNDLNHTGGSAMSGSAFCSQWNRSSALAKDGTTDGGRSAWESIKIVAGMCVAKKTMTTSRNVSETAITEGRGREAAGARARLTPVALSFHHRC